MDHSDVQPMDNAQLAVIKVNVPTTFGRGRKRGVQTASTDEISVGSSNTGTNIAPGDMGGAYEAFQKPTIRVNPLPASKWVVDDATNVCQAAECKQQFKNFSMFNRKHHCRSCGHIFCGNCSSNFMPCVDGSSSARLCQSCYYEHQLVVAKRQQGKKRRRSRGKLIGLQMTILIRFARFLSVEDLQEFSLVSSDFYFASRDNRLWHDILDRHGWTEGSTVAAANSPFNYTAFLSFVQRAVHEQCAGIASFASGLRELLSSSVKVSLIGPPGVGKTALVEKYCGPTLLENNSDSTRRPSSASASPPPTPQKVQSPTDRLPPAGFGRSIGTVGLTGHRKRTALSGALSTETTVSIYDVSGGERYGWIRQLASSSSHVIVLCYDAHSKVSLVKAALMMEEIEPSLTGQTVVVCGLLSDPRLKVEVNVRDAEAATVRCGASIQIPVTEPHGLFSVCVQTVIDRIASTFKPFLPVPTVLDVLLQ